MASFEGTNGLRPQPPIGLAYYDEYTAARAAVMADTGAMDGIKQLALHSGMLYIAQSPEEIAGHLLYEATLRQLQATRVAKAAGAVAASRAEIAAEQAAPVVQGAQAESDTENNSRGGQRHALGTESSSAASSSKRVRQLTPDPAKYYPGLDPISLSEGHAAILRRRARKVPTAA